MAVAKIDGWISLLSLSLLATSHLSSMVQTLRLTETSKTISNRRFLLDDKMTDDFLIHANSLAELSFVVSGGRFEPSSSKFSSLVLKDKLQKTNQTILNWIIKKELKSLIGSPI